ISIWIAAKMIVFKIFADEERHAVTNPPTATAINPSASDHSGKNGLLPYIPKSGKSRLVPKLKTKSTIVPSVIASGWIFIFNEFGKLRNKRVRLRIRELPNPYPIG